jgi:uncharacterized protein HemY
MHVLDRPDIEGYETQIESLEIAALAAHNKGEHEQRNRLTAEAAKIKVTVNEYKAKYPQKRF